MGSKPKLIKRNAELRIDRLGHKGDGMAMLAEMSVFVDGALEGEIIQSDIHKGNDNILRGKIVDKSQVLNASKNRIDPECKHGLSCGGCAMQHMSQDFYKEWKQSNFIEILERAGLTPETVHDPIFINANTRRRASFTLLKQNKHIRIGFREKRSHNIINIDECHVIIPKLFDLVQNMRPYLQDILRDSRACSMFIQDTDSGFDIAFTGEVGAKGEPDLNLRMAIADLIRELPVARVSWRKRERESYEILLEAHPVYHSFGDLNVALPVASFMQPSSEGEQVLRDLITSAIEAFQKAHHIDMLKIVDLFSGCGTFSGPLMTYGDVTAYELDKGAVSALSLGLKKADTGQHSQALCRNLFKEPLSESELEDFDVIVLDPPRAGAKGQTTTLAELYSNKPQLLIYVSCNPSSFARDAVLLTVNDEWHFESVTMIDQFIWSNHMELCAVFTKN